MSQEVIASQGYSEEPRSDEVANLTPKIKSPPDRLTQCMSTPTPDNMSQRSVLKAEEIPRVKISPNFKN